MSLISPENTWMLWAVILSGVALSIWLEQTFRWAARLSGPVLALVLAMVLSNLKVMPVEAPAYDVIWSYLVPVAIPLLLLRANLMRIAREAGKLFAAFHVSALGSMLGALIATLLLHNHVESAPQIGAIMTGSYIGGGVNFFALKGTYDVSENLTNPLLVADNFIMAGMFIFLLVLAGHPWLRRHFPHPHSLREDTVEARALAAEHWKRKEISLRDIAQALAIAFVIVALAKAGAALCVEHIGNPLLVAVLGNPYVLITLLSTGVATLFHRQLERVNGAEDLGGYLLYVFLFAVGLPADLRQVFGNAPLLFVFCLIMALTNLVVTLALGKLLKFDLEELLVCVNASLGGAPSAAAMAVSKGWPKLILPGVLVGIWGYVVGTFLGVVMGLLLTRIVG